MNLNNTLYDVFFLRPDGKADGDYGRVGQIRSDSGVAKLPCDHSCRLADARRSRQYTCICGQRYAFVEVCDCASCAAGLTCWRSSRPVIAAGSETESPVREVTRHLAGDVLTLNPEAYRGRSSFRYGGVLFVPFRRAS